jgi:hypothetical protein
MILRGRRFAGFIGRWKQNAKPLNESRKGFARVDYLFGCGSEFVGRGGFVNHDQFAALVQTAVRHSACVFESIFQRAWT